MAAPRLLDKKTVNAEVATQKKRQIDEGLNLAKKVDALRETKQEEEARLEKFRMESVKKIQNEIDYKVQERDALEDILVPMRAEYERLLVPPDLTEEREKVKKDAKYNEEESKRIAEGKRNLDLAISLNIRRERHNEEQEQRLSEEKRRSEDNLVRTEALKDDAIKELFKARAEAQKIINAAKEREEAVKIREEEVAIREIEVEKVKKHVDVHELNLASREKKLRVNQETFMKSKAYLMKK